MSSTKTSHCRLCAKMEPVEKLIDMLSDNTKRDEILKKLSRLNADTINSFERNSLPNTVCLICLESLDRAYEFVVNIEHAQHTLSSSYCGNVKIEVEVSVSDNSDTHTDGDNDEEAPLTPNNPVKDEPVVDNIVETPKKSVKRTSRQPKLQLTWKDYKWACAKCENEFPTIEEFTTHSMLLHDCCNAFKCKDCNKRILRLDKFLIHVKRHKNDLKLSCYACNSEFPTPHKANVHKNVHSSEHICAGCNTQFANKEDLTQHVRLYYKNRYGNSLTVVDTSDSLTCILCKKTFKNKGSFKGHLLIHVQANPKERVHTCDRCGKGYFTKAALAAHEASHQETCPFQCELCKSEFKTPLRLKVHMEVHKDSKPYACEQCGRRFRIKKQLSNHSIIHTDSLPFVCPHCSKAFRFKSVLNLHLRQHTGAKPYTCDKCQRNFTNWSNWNKHMKRKHGISMVKRKIDLSSMKKTMPLTNDSNISNQPSLED